MEPGGKKTLKDKLWNVKLPDMKVPRGREGLAIFPSSGAYTTVCVIGPRR